MGLLNRGSAVVLAVGAAASSPHVREALRDGAVEGLAASMAVAEAIAGATRGAWDGAQAAVADAERSRSGEPGSGA